jgi:hypothetical protein
MFDANPESIFRKTVEIFNTIINNGDNFEFKDLISNYESLYGGNRNPNSFGTMRELLNSTTAKVVGSRGKYKKIDSLTDEDIRIFYENRTKKYKSVERKLSTKKSNSEKHERLLKNIASLGKEVIDCQEKISRLERELAIKDQELLAAKQNKVGGLEWVNDFLKKIESRTGVQLEKI